ncbi:MAG: DUF3237 family protein [Polyangiaceae bacterium]
MLFWSAPTRVAAYGFAFVLATVISCSDGPSHDGSAGSGGTSAVAGASNALGGTTATAGRPGQSEVGGRLQQGGTTGAATAFGGTRPTLGSALGGAATSTGGAAMSSAGGSGGRTSTSHVGGTTSGGSSSSINGVTLVPDASWACGMAGGIPEPTRGTLVLNAKLQLQENHEVGETQYGHRRMYVVKGGTFTGDKVKGTVLAGGFDFELTLSNGSVELEEILVLRTSDNTPIYLRICGVAPGGAESVRIVPDFEVATSSSAAWLNSGKFVGTRVVDSSRSMLELEIYDVANVAASEPRVQLKDPAGVPNQQWECSGLTGTKGATVFTETVTLGASVSIGASKRGTRNIIPITGGTTSGRVTGAIVAGGGDYQLVGTSTTLDARYALATSDGEYVLVRNCGAMNALAPQFEARVAGSYAFLNDNQYLSSAPGSATGGVSITFYERK